jgi:hypothetical protein
VISAEKRRVFSALEKGMVLAPLCGTAAFGQQVISPLIDSKFGSRSAEISSRETTLS